MPRQNLYYNDIRDPITGWRWRLVLTPAYNQTLPATAVPAFGAGTRVGIYIPIPGRTFFRPPENEDAGYDDRPTGPVEFPTMKLSLNVWSLRGNVDSNGDGVSDWEDLRNYMVNQSYAGGGTIEGRTFNTTMLWTMLTDRGDDSLAVGAFEVYFEGVQRPRPGRKWKVNRKERIVRLDAELVHLARYAPELIIADDVATRLQNSPPSSPVITTATYETLWQDGAHSVTLAHTREGPMDNPQGAHMYRLVDLWHTISTCIEDVLKSITRSTATFEMSSWRGMTISGRNVGTPLDVFRFFRQSYTIAGGKGAEITPFDLHFVGRVYWISSGIYIGGFLRNDGAGSKSESLFRWPNLWDFLIDSCGPAKMILRHTGLHQMSFYWARIQEGGGAPIALGPADFAETEIEFDEGAGTIRGTSAEPAENTSETIEFKLAGLNAEPDHTVKCVFSNHPDGSPENDEFIPLYSPSRFLTPMIAVAHPGFRGFGLYYLDHPSGITFSQIPIRPHHYVELHDGTAYRESDCIDEIELPMIPDGFRTNDVNGYETYLWVPLRRCYSDMTVAASIPFASAKGVTSLFAAEHQTVFTGTFSMGLVWWKDLGRLCDAATFPNANGFLWDSATFFSAIPGRPHILRVQDNPGECTTKIELLAQG